VFPNPNTLDHDRDRNSDADEHDDNNTRKLDRAKVQLPYMSCAFTLPNGSD